MKDEITYYKEMYMLDKIRITFQSAGLSEDATRFRIRNDFFREDGKLAASLTTDGGWLSFETRKLIIPPKNLADAMRSLVRTDDFEVLQSSVKK